jgi:RNA polymerase sigma factor (TIGR02999 family)
MDATELLRAWSEGDEGALNELVPLVEKELHRLARAYMRRERHDHTLQATALVNEAFLRLARPANPRWEGRAHFVGIAARLMRQVLVDHARSRGYQKRGGGGLRVPLDHAPLVTSPPELDVLAVDRALEAFAKIDPRKSQVVELRFFGGLSVEETADVLGISVENVKRDWRCGSRGNSNARRRGRARDRCVVRAGASNRDGRTSLGCPSPRMYTSAREEGAHVKLAFRRRMAEQIAWAVLLLTDAGCALRHPRGTSSDRSAHRDRQRRPGRCPSRCAGPSHLTGPHRWPRDGHHECGQSLVHEGSPQVAHDSRRRKRVRLIEHLDERIGPSAPVRPQFGFDPSRCGGELARLSQRAVV